MSLQIENLSYQYPKQEGWALRNVSLKVEKGEFIVLTGPSGCGKTTLALVIVGYIPHVIERGKLRGRVVVEGVEPRKVELHRMTQIVNVVLQNPEDQLFALTVEEDVAFGPENLALPKEEISRRIKKAMMDAGVWHIKDREIFTLSGGQKQRTAIAGVLAMEPKILIFDEPTSDLDPQGAQSVLKVIKDIQKKRDVTVILIEHRLDEVSQYADRIILMDEGRIILDEPPEKAYRKATEFLKRGVRPPQVTEVVVKFSSELPEKVPVTLEEAAKYLTSLRGKRKYPKPLPPKTLKTSDSIVRFEDVWVKYPDGTVAVKGVSFSVYRNELLAIIGRNGSGKTTLTRLLIGVLKPWKGKVYVKDMDVSKVGLRDLVKVVGYVFQNPDHQLFTNTVWDELSIGPRAMGLPPEEVEKRVREVLEMLDLVGFEKRHPQALSRGQKRRLAVATVLTMRPEILVLDEPTTGQDWGHVVEMMNLVRKLVDEWGLTAIVITHDMRVVAEYANRVVLMEDGKVLFEADPREAFNRPELAETSISPPYIYRLAGEVFTDKPPVLTVEEFIEGLK